MPEEIPVPNVHPRDMVPNRLCDSCRHCRDKEMLNGHKRRGWCSLGYGWVTLGKMKQCLYYGPKGSSNA